MRSGAMGVLSLFVLLIGCGDGTGPEPSGKRFQVLAEIHGPQFDSLRLIKKIGESDLVVSGDCFGPCTVTTSAGDTFSFAPMPAALELSSDPFFFRMTKDGVLKWRGSIASTGIEDVIVASSTNGFSDVAFTGQIGPESDVLSADGSMRHYSAGGERNAFVSFFNQDGMEKRTVVFQDADYSRGLSIDWVSDDAVVVAMEFMGSIKLPLAGGQEATVASRGGQDALVVKMGNDGIVKWWVQLGGVGWEMPWALKAFSDGSIKVALWFESSSELDRMGEVLASQDAVGINDILVLSLNSEGRVAWSFSSGARNSKLMMQDIIEREDGGFFSAGSYWNGSMLQGTDGKPVELVFYGRHYDSTDGYIASFDKEGRLKWATSFGGWTLDRASIVDLLPNGNLRVSGFGVRQGFSIGEISIEPFLDSDGYQLDFDSGGNFVDGSSAVLVSEMPDAIRDSIILSSGHNIISLVYRADIEISGPDGQPRGIGCEGEADGLILRRIEDR